MNLQVLNIGMISILKKKLAQHLQLKHFLITGHSRNGFYLLLKAYNWDKESEIIIPAFTCSIIPMTIELAGNKYVPCDAEKDGLNIDPEEIKKAITKNTKAIYVVHTYGNAAKIDTICEIAKKHNLIVIEDLAHSLLYSYKGKKLGTYGDFSLLCFTKKIINFEGGAVGTNHTDIYNRMRALQLKYHSKKNFDYKDVLEKYGRIYGSYWESKFPFWIVWSSYIQYLIYMAFFHKKVFDEKQWFRVDNNKFIPSKISALITAGQLDLLKTRNKEMDYLKFKNKFKNKIQVYDKDLGEDDTPPAYYSGTIIKDNFLLKKICIPTWRNFNPVGKYPRADYLYTNYKIFSKIIMYL